jgi:hypothetical protein
VFQIHGQKRIAPSHRVGVTLCRPEGWRLKPNHERPGYDA